MSEPDSHWDYVPLEPPGRPVDTHTRLVEHFSRVIMGYPREMAPLEVRLRELAEKYNEQTETYDRTVCTSERRGVAMPSDGRESALINENARRVLDSLVEEGAPLGIGRVSIMGEIQRINRNRR